MKKRETISREELSSWVTIYLNKFKGCSGAVATVKYKLASPDKEGCNWSSDITVKLGKNNDSSEVERVLSLAVKEARSNFLVE